MENQQNNTEKKKPNRSGLFAFIFATLVFGVLIWVIVKDKEALADKNAQLLTEQGMNSTCTHKRDSLAKEVERLSIYKSLTKAMVHRDEATSLLKYQVGDFVYLKRDSSKVLISDIIIGGAKYEYYIRYKVMYKDKATEEVAPELLY